jgi:hypothetical protein
VSGEEERKPGTGVAEKGDARPLEIGAEGGGGRGFDEAGDGCDEGVGLMYLSIQEAWPWEEAATFGLGFVLMDQDEAVCFSAPFAGSDERASMLEPERSTLLREAALDDDGIVVVEEEDEEGEDEREEARGRGLETKVLAEDAEADDKGPRLGRRQARVIPMMLKVRSLEEEGRPEGI